MFESTIQALVDQARSNSALREKSVTRGISLKGTNQPLWRAMNIYVLKRHSKLMKNNNLSDYLIQFKTNSNKYSLISLSSKSGIVCLLYNEN